MINHEQPCLIWETPATRIILLDGKEKDPIMRSPRTGGDYKIKLEAYDAVFSLDEKDKAKLTTLLIDLRRAGDHAPWITADLIKKAKRADPLSPQKRAERLLQYLANKWPHVGQEFVIPMIAHDMEALAWCESIEGSEREFKFLIDHLIAKGWLDGLHGEYKMTVDGYEYLEQQGKKKDFAQCFVAMWFNDSMNPAYDEGIEKAVIECGYTSKRIDQQHHLNKICDEAIAQIRRSRFVVADFTHGTDGARGSVFYEAGFAHALGLPVIFSCRKDQAESLHFDTRQYPHILWTTPEDLYAQLRDKIRAILDDYKAEPALAV